MKNNRYYQVTAGWIQAVFEDGMIIDAYVREENAAIMKQKDSDPMGPRIGKKISQSQFKKQLNEIKKILTA